MKRIAMIILAAMVCTAMVATSVSAQDDEAKAKKEKKVKAPKEKKVKAPKEKKAKAPKEKKAKAPKEKKPKAPKPELQDLSIKGVITKSEEKKGEKTVVKYVLTDTEGNKITLPKPKKDLNLDDYLDAGVTVNGKGMKQKKKDKEIITFKEILSIDKGEAAGDVQVFPDEAPTAEGEDAPEGDGGEM